MDANYEKLYAYLAGQVDDSLQRIGAMLTAEEMFISETSVPDTETNFP